MGILWILRFLATVLQSILLENLPKVSGVIHLSSLPFKGGGPLVMWILSSSVSIGTLCAPPPSFPTCSPSLVIQPRIGTLVSEPPSTPALLLSLPPYPRLSLLVVWVRLWCRRQSFPRYPQRRLGQPRSVFKTLEEFFKPFSASISLNFSTMQWGKPAVIIKAHHIKMGRWWPSAIKLLLVWVAMMHKLMVIWEGRGSSMAFRVHVFPGVVPVFFRLSSRAVAPVRRIPVQFCKDFVRIKVWFLPWEPSGKVKNEKKNSRHHRNQ